MINFFLKDLKEENEFKYNFFLKYYYLIKK